ncbi:MAG: DUF554 domain-containing protein [Ruminococcaceae bacterium]|nr:DUF554 domain-containing protein [Oscillospiraceae bacterium]
MIGTLVNSLAVIVGGSLGLILNSRFPEKLGNSLMKALGLCVLLIGITGTLEGENQLITVISMAIGTIIGECLDLDKRLDNLGNRIQKKFNSASDDNKISQGFVNASLIFCVGAMSIVGSLQSGLTGNHQMIYTKSLLDFVSSIIFASTLGFGVLLSSVVVFIYQGSIVLLSQYIAPYLTEAVIGEMTCVGSLIIIGLALNLLDITKIKVMNYVPAIFLPILLYLFI